MGMAQTGQSRTSPDKRGVMETEPNKYMVAAQRRKEDALVAHLESLGVYRKLAEGFTRVEIEQASREAAVIPPSSTVWNRVLDRLPGAEKGEQGQLFMRSRVRRPWVDMARHVERFDAQFGEAGLVRDVDYHWVGSFRRGRPVCGDLDLLIVTDGQLRDVPLPSQLACRSMDTILHRDVDLADGTVLRVDVWRVQPSYLGPFLVFATGPKRLNITMRGRAQKQGLMLSQYGVFDEVGKRIDENTEEDVFVKLGMEPMTVEQRGKYGVRS